MMQHRLFLGIPLSEEARKALKKQLQTLPGRNVPSPNWHITLHFLGEVKEEQKHKLETSLEQFDFGSAFNISITHLGVFPSFDYAKILWLGLEEGEDLVTHLVTNLGDLLYDLDFRIDDRTFIPHITVSRFPKPKNISKWITHHDLEPVSMQVSEVILYESVLRGGSAPEYIKRKIFYLK